MTNPFTGLTNVLVQFKVFSGDISTLPSVIRRLDDETPKESDARMKRNEDGEFTVVLRRNGVVGDLVSTRLAEAGLTLVHAYAERRRNQYGGMYGLITFRFATEHEAAKLRQEELATAGCEALMKQLTRRWGEVRFVKFHSEEDEDGTVLIFASPAAQPVQSKVIEDKAAEALGLKLTASVPKRYRTDEKAA